MTSQMGLGVAVAVWILARSLWAQTPVPLPVTTVVPSISSTAVPQPQVTPAPKKKAYSRIPLLLQEVEDKYTAAGTLSAEFTQETESAALKTKKKSSGTLQVKRPNKLRWEVSKPDASVTVSDGKTFWMYTPPFDEDERGQVGIRKAKDVQTPLLQAILSGQFKKARGLKILNKGKSSFILIPPRKNSGGILRAEIDVDPKEKTIRKVTIDNQGGNRSEITLTKIELGVKLEDSIFQFTVPANTDQVSTGGPPIWLRLASFLLVK